MAHPAACPACHYPLVGETQRWADACPLSGSCPECGAAFRWSDVFAAQGQPPWAYDVPGVRGLALGRWVRTTSRLLHPARYWRTIGGRRLAPRRLILWLVLTMGVLHVFNAAWMVIMSWEYILESWWRSAATMTELLASPYFDMGEMNAKNVLEPMFFLDRPRTGLAAGSIAAGALLVLLGAARTPPGRDATWRAAIYGLMPLAFMYILHAAGLVLVFACEKLGYSVQWWYGWPTAAGRIPGGAVWSRRAFDLLTVAWIGLWWWHAAGACLPAPRRLVRAMVTATPIVVGMAIYLRYLVYWNRWWML